MKTNITYRKDLLIAAVGPSVWAKLGPEDWFDNYRLVAANAREYVAPFVRDLAVQIDDLEKFTTTAIVETDAFRSIAASELADYRFIIYRPIEPVDGIAQERFISNDISYSRFEDKKVFRDTFVGKLPIPDYKLVEMQAFLDTPSEEAYAIYRDVFGDVFVAQDNNSGGGRGTFIIKTTEDVQRAQKVFTEEGKGTHVVISRFVEGIERSIQVFVSENHIVRGPLQQQLVRNTELLDPYARGGMYFCGGRFIFETSDILEAQLSIIVTTAAETLRGLGYKGIFGIDFVVDKDEHISTIEINARTTGLLPLLNEQKVETPLYLLHILEVASETYNIEQAGSLKWESKADSPDSFVILFNTTGVRAYFTDEIKTGNYTFKDGMLTQIDDRARWHPDADVMIQLFASEEFSAKPNLKLANIFLKGSGFDDYGTLTDEAREIVTYLKQRIATTVS